MRRGSTISPLVKLTGQLINAAVVPEIARDSFDDARQRLSADAWEEHAEFLVGTQSTSFNGGTGREGDQ